MSHDYSQFKDPTGDNLLAQISATAADQKAAELEVAELEEKIQIARDKLKNISEVILPNLMDTAEMTSFTTKEGIKVECLEKIRAGISQDRAFEAYKWLADNGFDYIIKQQFVIEFDRNQEEWADKFEETLDKKLNVKRTKAVHAATLGAFVKEQLEEGTAIPLATFGVYRQRFTKIK